MADPNESEPIRLDPFLVQSEQDYGYRATNSITATGSSEPIKNIPLSISVITREFLEDRGVTEVIDALRDIPGVSASSLLEYDVYSRGFQSVLKTDGGEDLGNALTTHNVERIEVVKGATSILQGHASAGGVVNAISRRPKFDRLTSLRTSYGSFDYKMASFMHTGPIRGGKVAYLVGYSVIDNNGWVDYTGRQEHSIQLGLEFRPTSRLSINLDYQRMDRESVPQQHLTFTHPAFLAMELEAQALFDANGLSRPGGAGPHPRIGETTRAWLNRTPGLGPDEPTELINVNEVMYPNGYEANAQGPQAYRDLKSDKGFVEARFNVRPGIDWRTIYNYSEMDLWSATLASFRPSGGLILRERAVMSHAPRKREEITNELVSSFTLFGMKHRVLAGFNYRTHLAYNQNLQTGFINHNPRTDAPLNIVDRVLAAHPNGHTPGEFSKTLERGYYISDQMAAFDGRLNILAGARHAFRSQRGISSSRVTPQVGAVMQVPGVEGLGAYVSYGESFRPVHVLDANGEVVDPTIEKNIEAGLKIELLDGRISGSISVYDLVQSNVAMRDHAREADLGISPLYIFAGRAESAGAEAEIIYTPVRNYQVKFGYSRIWHAETVIADDVRQQGQRLKNAPEHQVTFWNKYTFTKGKLRNTFIAGGVQWTGENRIHASWSSPVYSKSSYDGTLLVGRKFKLRDVETDVSLRVDNLFDQFYYEHTFRPVQPRRFHVNANFRF